MTRFGIIQGMKSDYAMRMPQLRNIDGVEQAEDSSEAFSLPCVSGHDDRRNVETDVLTKTGVFIVVQVFTV